MNIRRTAKICQALAEALKSEEGQGLVEYGLIILLSSIAVVTALGVFGSNLSTRFDQIVGIVASL